MKLLTILICLAAAVGQAADRPNIVLIMADDLDFSDFALKFIDEGIESKKPLFLYMAYNAPHYPLQAPEEDVMKYRGKYKIGWDKLREQRYARQVASGLLDEQTAKLSPRPDYISAWDSVSDEKKDGEDFRMATYAAMIDRRDRNIGRLVAHLKEKGIYENTHNLAGEKKEKTAELSSLWHKMAEETDHLPAKQRKPVSKTAKPYQYGSR